MVLITAEQRDLTVKQPDDLQPKGQKSQNDTLLGVCAQHDKRAFMKTLQLIPFSGRQLSPEIRKNTRVLLSPLQPDTVLEVPARNARQEKATEAPKLEKKQNDPRL